MSQEPAGDKPFRSSASAPADGGAGSPAPLPEGEQGNGSGRILPDLFYSLEEAAHLTGVREGRLRRAILLEDLPCEDVPDDRHYLIQGRVLAAYFDSPKPSSGRCAGRKEAIRDPWPAAAACFFVIVLVTVVLLILAGLPAPQPAESPRRVPTAETIPATTTPGPPPHGQSALPSW